MKQKNKWETLSAVQMDLSCTVVTDPPTKSNNPSKIINDIFDRITHTHTFIHTLTHSLSNQPTHLHTCQIGKKKRIAIKSIQCQVWNWTSASIASWIHRLELNSDCQSSIYGRRVDVDLAALDHWLRLEMIVNVSKA